MGDRLPKMLDFVILCFLSSFPYETPDWHSLQAKAVIELRRFYRSSPFQSICLQTGKGGSFGYLRLYEVLMRCHFEQQTKGRLAHAQFTCKHILPLCL